MYVSYHTKWYNKKYYPEKIFFSPESPTLQVNNEDSCSQISIQPLNELT